MIYWNLFLAFLEVGAVSFGGGYGMISLIREKCLNSGWLTEDALLNFIAVAESTPGPIAVNMATFVGSSQAGIWGAFVATLGLVLPSFAIILIIASVMRSLLKFPGVQAIISGIKPVVIGLILATAVTMLLSVIFNTTTISASFQTDLSAMLIFALLISIAILYKKIVEKPISPIILILISAILGMILY